MKKIILVTGANGQLGNELRTIAPHFPALDIVFTGRNELDITQTDLAELANVTKGTVIRYEKGEGNPSLSVLNKLLNVLGLELQVDVIKTK